MTALLIIISFIYVCPAASSGARTPRDTHTSTVSQMHTLFPRTLEVRTFLLIQKREGQLARVHL